MPGLTIVGGFYIKNYQGTRSHGPEPASAGGVGIVSGVGSVPISVGDYVALSFMGVVFYGVAAKIERLRSLQDGDEYSFQILDNRIRLRWGIVCGRWNLEADASLCYSDPLPEMSSALDEWSGGEVGFDQNVDFLGGIESSMGSPSPVMSSGAADRGKMFEHIPPGNWLGQMPVYTQEPLSAREIITQAVRGSKGGNGLSFNFHAAQSKPVFGVDYNAGGSLSGFLQQMADAQGLQMTMDGFNTVRFTRRGEGVVVIPSGAHVKSLGSAISSEPTKVRVVGGMRLVQVNEVPMVADWNRSWEKFLSEAAWLEEVKTVMSNVGPLPDDPAQRAEIAARAREMTLAEYINEKSITVDNPADLEAEYADNGRWDSVSRMDLPVWKYLNSVVFRSYRVAEDAELFGMRIRSMKVSDRLLCAVTTKEVGGETRTVYRENPVEFYPQAAAFVLAKGQPLDLSCVEQTEALIRQRNKDLRDAWSVVNDFELDAVNHSIRFASPVFIDGNAEEGKSILLYPNRGEGDGNEDLTEQVPDGSSYLDIVVPNPNFEIEPAEVRVAMVFELGITSAEFGSGARWTSHHVSGISEHLLYGQEGFNPPHTRNYERDLWIPDSPEAGFIEILYDNDQSAFELAEDQTAGLIVRPGVEESGSYVRHGAAGASLTGAIDRINVTISSIESGLVEEVEFSKPRSPRGFRSTREMAERLRNDELWDGQKELSREVRELRAISKAFRTSPKNDKIRTPSWGSMPDVFRKPVGTADVDVRTLHDPNSQYPERSSGSGGEGSAVDGWKVGDLVWVDSSQIPSRVGCDFGGVVVMDSPLYGSAGSSSAVKFVSVASSGKVPVRVETGLPAGAAIFGTPGDSMGRARGTYYIGRLAHSSATPEAESDVVLALVELSAPSPAGRYKVFFSQEEQRLYVREGSVIFLDMLSPGSAKPVFPKLADQTIDIPSYWSFSGDGGDSPDNTVECVPDVDYSVVLVLSSEPGHLEFREQSSSGGESGDEEAKIEIATIRFKQVADSEKLVVDDFNQLWESDVIWPKSESSSSSQPSSSNPSSSALSSSGVSSEESSAPSDGSLESDGLGSSKDSAIVRGPDGGYLKWYCMEATEVLFFDFQEFSVGSGLSKVDIDPVVCFCIEKGTLRAFASPDIGSANVTVHGDCILIRSRFSKRQKKQTVQVMLKGVRRGFLGVRNQCANFEEFVDNECRLNPRMTRDQIIDELAKRGVTE